MTSLRFRLGHWLMRRGLAVMPKGRSREELALILRSWSRHTKEAIDASRDRDPHHNNCGIRTRGICTCGAT